jgi:hypothetical protein
MKKNLKEVRVFFFTTNAIKDVKGNVPNNYLEGDTDIPSKLIDEVKANGWSDSQGHIWWDKDFQPAPVKALDGNVYLCLSDVDIKNPLRMHSRLKVAANLLRN